MNKYCTHGRLRVCERRQKKKKANAFVSKHSPGTQLIQPKHKQDEFIKPLSTNKQLALLSLCSTDPVLEGW